MTEALSSFLFGFIMWWIAYGAVGYKPLILRRFSTRRMLQVIMLGSGACLYALAQGWALAYIAGATIVGGLWGVYWNREKVSRKLT